MRKCPDCHKYWEENWKGQQYCPECGQLKTDAIARAKRDNVKIAETKEETRQKTIAEIVRKIDAHPVYGYMRRLALRMFEEHGISGRVIFRNRQSSYCRKNRDGSYTICFSYSLVDEDLRGYREYPKTTHAELWGNDFPVGIRAAWAHTIHEFAHVVQGETEQRRRGQMHTRAWVQAVKDLRTLYPIQETDAREVTVVF